MKAVQHDCYLLKNRSSDNFPGPKIKTPMYPKRYNNAISFRAKGSPACTTKAATAIVTKMKMDEILVASPKTIINGAITSAATASIKENAAPTPSGSGKLIWPPANNFIIFGQP